MTLVAAFVLENTPVLLGDYTLSNGRSVVGARRQLLRVTPNFAFGWTGHLSAAHSIACTLQRKLARSNTTLAAVQRVLTDPGACDFGTLSVMLACWVVDDDGQHCFRWRSDYPTKIYPDL